MRIEGAAMGLDGIDVTITNRDGKRYVLTLTDADLARLYEERARWLWGGAAPTNEPFDMDGWKAWPHPFPLVCR